ncbi:5-aminolevulinate synthase [Streptomyces canus]|uniref:5-aminolevulinic acid synthase n=1 Tax=Streptomyces canus TaxID=58343 RepID=A0A101SEX8_9ACTN|nr:MULTISPECIES: 5-aminolevulinate synthase [Streptomyces]KUN72679.1 5-aminolevulinate synthase [Streptomyces canus]MDI5913008.1 5-aminolevulinate synthase [Streptomyces sp. 12257]
MYEQFLSAKLRDLQAGGQYREFVDIDRRAGAYPTALRRLADGTRREVTVWCSNDYLGMSQHPKVLEAMHRAVDEYGAGSGGSRNIGGTHAHYRALETSLAEWHGKEAALVFPTGYGSNDATLQCLLRLLPDPIVLSDELNHASLINGIRSTRAERAVFRHNDVDHLRELLTAQPHDRAKIVVFESVYSMDGDVAPIEEIAELAREHNALTFLDEVHAIGMYGPRGSGLAADLGVDHLVDIVQGTMAKAIGVIGGYIAGSATLVDAVRSFASGFIFTTSLPPAVVAACHASVEHLKNSEAERRTLHDKTRRLRDALAAAGITVMPCSTTHVLPVLVGDATACKRAAVRLLEEYDVYLQPINSPTVPVGTERFRVNVTPNHTDADIAHLVEALSEVLGTAAERPAEAVAA